MGRGKGVTAPGSMLGTLSGAEGGKECPEPVWNTGNSPLTGKTRKDKKKGTYYNPRIEKDVSSPRGSGRSKSR